MKARSDWACISIGPSPLIGWNGVDCHISRLCFLDYKSQVGFCRMVRMGIRISCTILVWRNARFVGWICISWKLLIFFLPSVRQINIICISVLFLPNVNKNRVV